MTRNHEGGGGSGDESARRVRPTIVSLRFPRSTPKLNADDVTDRGAGKWRTT
jgi:hypothetical protein